MKRLIDFILRRPRNKPGGMAWISGISEDNGSEALNGRAVRTVCFRNGKWQIDPPQAYLATKDTRFLPCGSSYRRGEVVVIVAVVDEHLEPWKDDGVTHEEVAQLYSPHTKEVPMSTTAHKHRILRAIAQGPCHIRQFNDGNFGLATKHVRCYVDEMQDAGLLMHRDDDMLEITEAGLAEVERPASIAAVRQLPMQPWQPMPWLSARAGADDHKRFKSLS